MTFNIPGIICTLIVAPLIAQLLKWLDNRRVSKIRRQEQDAIGEIFKFFDDLLSKASEYAKNISSAVESAKNEYESSDAISKGISDIEEGTGTKFSVIMDFVYDMLTGDGKLKSSECTLDEWGYHIEQWVIQY